MADTKKKATDIARKKRLQQVQELHSLILEKKDISKISRLVKVAYVLWQYPNTRNSDRTHAIQYYKLFYPEYVENEQITFENIYKIPKMYDLQRDRATIQNTEELFPPKTDINQRRQKQASEYQLYYKNKNPEIYINDANYYLYLDESGKNDKYFVLAGILINSDEKKKNLEKKLSEIKSNLNSKHNMNINEWKFTNINHKNKNYYIDLFDEIKKLGMNIVFISVIVENSGLSSESKKNKTKELLKFIVKDCLDMLTLYTCRASYENVVSNLNVTLDNDGAGIDILQQEQIKSELISSIGTESKYFTVLDDLCWKDSKDDNFIQIADMYASSLNNIFSEKPIEGENSQAKKDFAKKILADVGISSVFSSRNNDKNFEYINKCITTEDIPAEFKV